MARYRIRTPIKRGGVIHRDTIELSAAEAAPLLASKALDPNTPRSATGGRTGGERKPRAKAGAGKRGQRKTPPRATGNSPPPSGEAG